MRDLKHHEISVSPLTVSLTGPTLLRALFKSSDGSNRCEIGKISGWGR
jgi:hypothetical protein